LALTVVLRLAFVILSRRNVSAVNVGVSARTQNALVPMRKGGETLGAMSGGMVPMARHAGTSPSRSRTGGDAL
jgi:hypothetical protein